MAASLASKCSRGQSLLGGLRNNVSGALNTAHETNVLSQYLRNAKPQDVQRPRSFSSFNKRDELQMEEEAEKKIGWLLKIFFVGTAAAVGYQFFPYLGDNVIHQSVSLLQVNDPFFKRTGASRLARFATDDERRMKIVEKGGAQHLLKMLENAEEDSTRKAALKALAALSDSDEAAGALHRAGAIAVIKSTPHSSEEADIERVKSSLLKRFQELRLDNLS